MKKGFPHWVLGSIFALCLIGFTLYMALDTFVISHVERIADTSTTQSATTLPSYTSPYSQTTASEETAASSDPALASETETTGSDTPATLATEDGSHHGRHGRDNTTTAAQEVPATDPATEPATDPVTEPVTEPATEASSTNPFDQYKAYFTDTPQATANTYSDSRMAITLSTYTEYNTVFYVADIVIASPDVLTSAFADNSYGHNVKDETSKIAEEIGAVLAINGDYYGARSSGYVIRNGVLYRSKSNHTQDLVYYNDGRMEIINEDDITAEELLANGAMEVWSFGPSLVQNGEVSIGEAKSDRFAEAKNPRTAIGYYGPGHYVFVVCDGRQDASAGFNLEQMAQIMDALGVECAYNLDGGGSSSLYFLGNLINKPATNWNDIDEREVSDIVCLK